MNQTTTNNRLNTEKTNTENKIGLSNETLSKLTYKIRCPECITLYEVDAAKISTLVPEFECSKCHCLFSFDYPPINPNAVLTFKLPSLEFDFKRNCPKCQHYQSDKNQICVSCGVVMENYILIQNETYPKVSIELIKLWQKVIHDFSAIDNHEVFIRKCLQKEATDYALFKYKELAKTLNDSKDCDHWIKFINDGIKEKENRDKIVIQRSKTVDFQYLNEIMRQLKRPNVQILLYSIPLAIGSFLIIFGLFNTAFRNGIGVGIALMILTFGFIAFRRHD